MKMQGVLLLVLGWFASATDLDRNSFHRQEHRKDEPSDCSGMNCLLR